MTTPILCPWKVLVVPGPVSELGAVWFLRNPSYYMIRRFTTCVAVYLPVYSRLPTSDVISPASKWLSAVTQSSSIPASERKKHQTLRQASRQNTTERSLPPEQDQEISGFQSACVYLVPWSICLAAQTSLRDGNKELGERCGSYSWGGRLPSFYQMLFLKLEFTTG